MKPRLFIGSSSENLDVANDIQQNLRHDGEVIVWNQGIFQPMGNVLDDLIRSLTKMDFGIFVFTPNDISIIRGERVEKTRDNIIFELGLFIGKLGKFRTFFIIPEGTGSSFKLPSDLIGVNALTYDSRNNNLLSALGPACNQIRKSIKSLGKRDDSKIDIIQTQRDVYAYMFNHLHPYKDITITKDFLKDISIYKRFTKIDDVLYSLDKLVHHYVPQFIESWMRVYFAYKLNEPFIPEEVIDSSLPQKANYRVGIAYSENQDKWYEGLPIGIPSNVHRVYSRNTVSKVRNAKVQLNSHGIQNQTVENEGSVIASPVLFRDDEQDLSECIGVIGISSPNQDEVSSPEYEAFALELSTLFSALFYSYGRYLQRSLKFDDVVKQIRFNISDHYDSKFLM